MNTINTINNTAVEIVQNFVTNHDIINDINMVLYTELLHYIINKKGREEKIKELEEVTKEIELDSYRRDFKRSLKIAINLVDFKTTLRTKFINWSNIKLLNKIVIVYKDNEEALQKLPEELGTAYLKDQSKHNYNNRLEVILVLLLKQAKEEAEVIKKEAEVEPEGEVELEGEVEGKTEAEVLNPAKLKELVIKIKEKFTEEEILLLIEELQK